MYICIYDESHYTTKGNSFLKNNFTHGSRRGLISKLTVNHIYYYYYRKWIGRSRSDVMCSIRYVCARTSSKGDDHNAI